MFKIAVSPIHAHARKPDPAAEYQGGQAPYAPRTDPAPAADAGTAPPGAPDVAARQRAAGASPDWLASMQFAAISGRIASPASAASGAASAALAPDASNAPGKLTGWGERFNPASISDRQMKQLAGELRQEGMISEWEYADMTTVLSPHGAGYDPDQPRNRLGEYQGQIAFSRVYSTARDTSMLTHITELLLAISKGRS